MTIHTVKILVGFRFMLTNDAKWIDFCEKLQDYVNGDGSEDDEDNSEDDSEGDAVDQVWDNMDKLMEDLREEFPDVVYNTITCFHNKEGMDRMIDIGYELGDFSVCGDHETSHHDIDFVMDVMKNAKKTTFKNKLAELFLWKFCVNKTPQMLGQADNCVFC